MTSRAFGMTAHRRQILVRTCLVIAAASAGSAFRTRVSAQLRPAAVTGIERLAHTTLVPTTFANAHCDSACPHSPVTRAARGLPEPRDSAAASDHAFLGGFVGAVTGAAIGLYVAKWRGRHCAGGERCDVPGSTLLGYPAGGAIIGGVVGVVAGSLRK